MTPTEALILNRLRTLGAMNLTTLTKLMPEPMRGRLPRVVLRMYLAGSLSRQVNRATAKDPDPVMYGLRGMCLWTAEEEILAGAALWPEKVAA